MYLSRLVNHHGRTLAGSVMRKEKICLKNLNCLAKARVWTVIFPLPVFAAARMINRISVLILMIKRMTSMLVMVSVIQMTSVNNI